MTDEYDLAINVASMVKILKGKGDEEG